MDEDKEAREINPSDWYLAKKGRPAFYIIIYNQPKPNPGGGNPARPGQILSAETWEEAQQFARAFLSMGVPQYVYLSALAPWSEAGSFETNNETYWREGNVIMRKESHLPAEVLRSFAKYAPPIAQESEGEKRMRKFARMKVKPGEFMVDVLNRQWEAQLAKHATEEWTRLWKYRSLPAGQTTLFPQTEEEGEEKKEPKPKERQSNIGEAFEEEEEEKDVRYLTSQPITLKGTVKILFTFDPDSGRPHEIVAAFWKEGRNPENDEPTFVRPDDFNPGGAREIIDYVNGGMDNFDLYYEARRNGMSDKDYVQFLNANHLPHTKGQYWIQWDPKSVKIDPLLVELSKGGKESTRESVERLRRTLTEREAKRRTGPEKQTDIGAFEVDAFEREGGGWDKPLSSGQGYFTLRQWAIRNKSAEADSSLLQGALEEARTSNGDMVASEARARVEYATEEGDHPWIDIHKAIDFESIEEKERMDQALREQISKLEPQLKELLQTGRITKEEAADILSLTPIERLTSKQKRDFQHRIEELEKELAEIKKPPEQPTTVAQKHPERIPAAQLPFKDADIDLLYNVFRSWISRKFRRAPTAPEVGEFDKLLDAMQRQKPPLKFPQARMQVENLAKGIAAIGTSGRMVVRWGQKRISELLDKSISEGLNPAEEEELRELEEAPARVSPFKEEEIQYEPPSVYIVADSGPWPGSYPRRLGGYWNREGAEQNLANWEKNGFKVRIEEERD